MVEIIANMTAHGFLWSFNRNVVIAILIIVALVMRIVSRKLKQPKWLQLMVWWLICLRLVIPDFLTTPWSLVPSASTFHPGNLRESTIHLTSGINVLDQQVNNRIFSHYTVGETAGKNELSMIIGVVGVMWMIGMGVFFYLYIRDTLRLKKRLSNAQKNHSDLYYRVFISSNIEEAFVYGLRKATIYVPDGSSESEMKYILLHETTHVRHGDHILKVILYFFLMLNWYNPLVWLMYVLANQDIELACDESVVKKLAEEERKAYAKLLYACSSKADFCPGRVMFRSENVVARIKSIVTYQNKSKLTKLIAAVCLVLFILFFMSNPSVTGAQINFQVKYPATQEYVAGQGNIKGNVNVQKFEAISEDFAIGANAAGYAVFKNPGKAWDTFVEKYADGIALVQKEYTLLPLTSKRYEMYLVYGWQAYHGTEEEKEQAHFVSSFLDIYDNSY